MRRSASFLEAAGALFRALPGLVPTFLVIALLGCVLVPLPTGLVDLLLSASLAGSVLLLVASLGIRRTSEFLAFPTLVLLATLYRLALNVSTTRLILSQADAGRVVDAFASVVVRDDLVVGGVMFLVITIIQYIVIARGAERVAEVAARFALDGLPGHQAAIEADVRAGIASGREAARRRARLAETSSFYGAMDGAVRFVKGDAIAGLAITAVNLVGGVAIGVGRMGWSWQESLEVFGRLTVGDGLLAQIPALLVSLAAGVLASRVDRVGDEPSEFARWLDPAMLIVPATLLAGLAFVPGMPALAFITTAVGLVAAALLLATRLEDRAPVRVGADSTVIHVRRNPAGIDDVRQRERVLAGVRARCGDALAIEVPRIDLVLDPDLAAGRLDVRLGESLLARTDLAADASEDDEVVAVFRAVMENAERLVDLPTIDRDLEGLRASHPALVQRGLAPLEAADLLAVVRGLLRERLAVPPLPAIVGAIAESRRLRDPNERARLPELLRERLAGHWGPGLLDALERLGPPRWVAPTPDVEDELLERAVISEDGLTLALDDALRAQWRGRIADAAADASHDPPGPVVVLTSPRARRAFAELLHGSAPHVPVFSTAELARAGMRQRPAAKWIE